MFNRIRVSVIFLVLLIPTSAYSQSSPPSSKTQSDTLRRVIMPQVDVIGKTDQLQQIPGSATKISTATLQKIAPLSGNELFRLVPGVHVVDEEGVGMRVNIGIRGLDPDRSRTVLILEDGVPVALAPYGEPEMYYTPAIERMNGIEVLKGSGSILYGPQTFGGVINYQTANPPAVPTFHAKVRGGQDGYLTGRFSYGATSGNAGFVASYLRKQGDNVGLVDFGIHDLSSKFNLILSDRSIMGIKLGLYDESSNSTYVGLTQAMYESESYDQTQLAPDDELAIRRYSGSLIHDFFFNKDLQLRTTLFAYTTKRNWSRQDFAVNPSSTATYIRTVGDTSQPGGALYFLDRTGNRNRAFDVYGIEPRLTFNNHILGMDQNFQIGARFLFERALEQRIDGTMSRPTSGLLREDEVRTGYAWSSYIQSHIQPSTRLHITPGVRLEHFRYERDIMRLNNEVRNQVNSNNLTEIIPGIGFNYEIANASTVFAGIHRGFGPPRVKDAISNSGYAEELDAEHSWNMEIGTRLNPTNFLQAEITLYRMAFANQIIPISESSGNGGMGNASLVNGGATSHRGLELAVQAEAKTILESQIGLAWNINATISDATFSEDRFIQSGGNTINVNGNTLPYAPKYMISTGLDGTIASSRISIQTTLIGKQFGDALNSEAGSIDGRSGAISAYMVVDAGVNIPIPGINNVVFSANVKNMLNKRYIVSRRPQGIRVGLARFITAGIEFRL